MSSVSVIIASYGDKSYWDSMAERAIRSIGNQKRPPNELIRIHDESLHEARNKGASKAKSEWLCFLDCDDELEPDYLDAMMGTPGRHPQELRYPLVRYVSESIVNPANYPKPQHLKKSALWRGNYMVIGTLVQWETFFAAEGFRECEAFEDWDLWIRCWMVGAQPVLVPEAIYRAWRRPKSRNKVKDPQPICKEIIEYNKEWNAKRKLLL